MSDAERRCPWRSGYWLHAFNFEQLSDFLDLSRHCVSLRAVCGEDSVERRRGLSTREISFTYQSGAMKRFMAFDSPNDWRKAVLKAVPLKMDFGAVYRDSVSSIQERENTLSAVKAICVVDRNEFEHNNYDLFTGERPYSLLAEPCGVTEYAREQYGHYDVKSLFDDRSLCDGISSLAVDEVLVEKAFEPMRNRVALSEFRGDIDLPDYPYPGHRELLDADKNVAAQYWLLLCISIECVDRWLRDSLGLQNVLWVLSGGKGVHFVCGDALAMRWTTPSRTALVGYFNVNAVDIARTTYTEKLYKQRLEHPHVAMMDAVIKPRFAELVEQLGCLRAEFVKKGDAELPFAKRLVAGKIAATATADRFLVALREGPVKERMHTTLVSMINPGRSAQPCAKDVLDELERTAGVGYAHYLVALWCHIAAPRLDTNVTNQAHHLLKMPLVPHHSTNKIAVPIKVSKWDAKTRAWGYEPLYAFDRTSVPSLAAVMDEFKVTTPERYEELREQRATILGSFEAVMAAYLRKRNAGLREMDAVASLEF